MSQKQAGKFRRMFVQPDDFNLLDVPEDAETAPAPPAETTTTRSKAPPCVPPEADLPDTTSPPPPLSLTEPGDHEDSPPAAPETPEHPPPPTEGSDGTSRAAETGRPRSGLQEAPTEPFPKPAAPQQRPPELKHAPAPTAPQTRRKPRAPGALRGVGPAEKGALLLERIRTGQSIHDHPFFDAYLSGAYLHGADLSCGQLQRVDFSGADLRGADLRESDLRGANLSKADLRGADLRGCRLELVRLEGADLRQARLSDLFLGTSGLMTRADLRGADLSGTELSATMSGARIDHRTYVASGWSPVQLAEASLIGMVIDEIERFPRLARAEVSGVQGGMFLQLSTPLTFQDRFVLQGMLCALLGPDCGGRLDALSGCRLLLTAAPRLDLTAVSAFLSDRPWEREAIDDEERALLSKLDRFLPTDFLRNELSFLADRVTDIALHRSDRTLIWQTPSKPSEALGHLLLKLFIPVELRWWLAILPDGKLIVRDLPEQESAPEAVVRAALSALKRRSRIDAALFRSLIEERPRQGAEIRAVAALWGVDLR